MSMADSIHDPLPSQLGATPEPGKRPPTIHEENRMMRSVSVIVVNWNGQNLLEECLDSLRKQTYPNFEMVIVDNASTDGSFEFLQQHFPEAKMVRLRENRGFTGGNIEGLRVAKGDYIALLNNDAVASAEWLLELVAAMDSDERVGICASKLLLYEDPKRIDCIGDGCSTSGHGYKLGVGEPVDQYDRKEYIFGGCAGAVLYRRKMLDEIGFLDEEFFIQCEDTDLNFRAQLIGWRCLYVPTAVVLHRIGSTIGRLNGLKIYYSARNDEFVWIKNMPTGLMLRFLHHKIIHEIGAFIYFCVKGGQWGPYLKGKLEAARMLPWMLRKRRAIQGRRRVSVVAIRNSLTPIFNRKLLSDKLRQLFASNHDR